MLSRNGKRNGDGSFNMKDALIDAVIMAGSTFFVTLGAVALVIGADPIRSVAAAAIAAGTEFFGILVLKRKLIKED